MLGTLISLRAVQQVSRLLSDVGGVPNDWEVGGDVDRIIWNLLVNEVIGGMPDDLMILIPAAMRDAQHGLGALLHIDRAVNTVSDESVSVRLD